MGDEPVIGQWASQAQWALSANTVSGSRPWRPADTKGNFIRLDEEADRDRDRVSTSFNPEDAVKDIRLHEAVMQYLRDRSA